MVEEAIQSEFTETEQKSRCVKLFGVNLLETKPQDVKRKSHFCISVNQNDSQISSFKLEAPRKRRKGVPWTEEEHLKFLAGLGELGKGEWKGISRSFVKTKTPTQVASHAQKHFLRQESNNQKSRRRRQSIFDIPLDSASIRTRPGPTTCTNTNTNIEEFQITNPIEKCMGYSPTLRQKIGPFNQIMALIIPLELLKRRH